MKKIKLAGIRLDGEKFLEYDEKIDFGIAERDVMLGGLLNWIKSQCIAFVVPARADRFGTWL